MIPRILKQAPWKLRKWAAIVTVTYWYLASFALNAVPVNLFDSRSFQGWEGDTNKTWRIVDRTILGGSLQGNPRNEFLVTTRLYTNFVLTLEYKLVGTEGFINGGVQFHSQRISNPPNEVTGFQADIGAGHSGSLYDESRRNRMLAVPDKKLISRLERTNDWNFYEIRVQNDLIRIRLNGEQTIEYKESDRSIPMHGRIALQIHGDCKAEISFRNIKIEELPTTTTRDTTESLNRLGRPRSPDTRGPFQGRFEIEEREGIAFIGQANLLRMEASPEFESRLALKYASKEPFFRWMAHEGDTVYEQWRDMNFGSWAGQLEWSGISIVFAQFGQIEAMDGIAKLPDFISAYTKLLDQFATQTRRLVLLSPMLFEEKPNTRLPNLTIHNDSIRQYSDAIQKLAASRGALYVDLMRPASELWPIQTENGMHLSPSGASFIAQRILVGLGITTPSGNPNADLVSAIAHKNRLWRDCWRPANWPFAYGDRVWAEYGKPNPFAPPLKEEFNQLRPLVEAADARVQNLALNRPGRSLPEHVTLISEPDTPSSKEELESFTLADGFQINLFASETDGVIKPIQFVWDEHGRLWVACIPTYPQITPGALPADFVMVCEDTDRDGKADRFTRFAERLNMPQGIELGDDGLYVCNSTELIHLKDTDGDGKADSKRVIASGFGIGDTHQLINSLTYGPDGSLWFTQGLHIISRIETPWGLSKLHQSGVWRLDPKTLRFDGFFNGAKAGHNCWGVVFDDYGQVFHKSGDRPDGYYTVPGMMRVPDPLEYHPTGSLFQTNPKTTAIDIIGTEHLPENTQGCAVIAGFMGSVIELHRFLDDGAGYKTEQLPKLVRSSTEAFRPVDVGVGPDGGIYIADWCNKVIGHYQTSYRDPKRDKTSGRIWRVTAKNRPVVSQPNLASMSVVDLLNQLESGDRWRRAQARRLLFNKDSSQVLQAADRMLQRQLASISRAAGFERSFIDLAGIYSAHGGFSSNLLQRLTDSSNPKVRAIGARYVGQWQHHLKDPLTSLRRVVQDPHPRVRLEAVVAASYVPSKHSIEVATEVMALPRDRFIDYALGNCARALREHWQKPFENRELAFGSNDVRVAFVLQHSVPDKAESPGAQVYKHLCLNCHQPTGKGLPGIYPPLAGSEWVSGDPTKLVLMLLHGVHGPMQVAGKPYSNVMPPSGLNDRQIADVLSHIRTQFGKDATAVSSEDVKRIRTTHSNRKGMWTSDELLKLPKP